MDTKKWPMSSLLDVWDKVVKNGPSKICGSQLFKTLKGYGMISP